MNQTMMNIRTVAVVKELTTETRHGSNGDFESKTILFRIATDRNYRTSRIEGGKTVMEYPTDFFLAKATGKVAEAMAQYCTAKKDNGKLVSRHLLVSGSFETYQKDVTEHVTLENVNINGMLYKVEGDVVLKNRTQTIFVIDSFSFLDKNTNPTQPNAAATATAAPMAAPQGQPTQPQYAAPQGQPAQTQYAAQYPSANMGVPATQYQQAPAQAAQPVQAAQPQYAAQAPAAPQGAPVAAGQPVPPAAPTVGQNFVASSGTAPF